MRCICSSPSDVIQKKRGVYVGYILYGTMQSALVTMARKRNDFLACFGKVFQSIYNKLKRRRLLAGTCSSIGNHAFRWWKSTEVNAATARQTSPYFNSLNGFQGFSKVRLQKLNVNFICRVLHIFLKIECKKKLKNKLSIKCNLQVTS